MKGKTKWVVIVVVKWKYALQVRSCCIRECWFWFPIQSTMRVFLLNWHIYVRPLVQFTRSIEGSYWIRIRFVFLFQIGTQSCGVRVYFVSLSYAFVFSSYPSCVLFMWGLKTSCQIRIQSCGFRVYFVFFSCGFVFSSFCACVSFLWVLESSCRIRIQSCGGRVFFVYFSSGFVFSS